jgi:2-polyprenyl-3-methyl-5-hydroxy-6-metoxy-1,4-benzoquinol methylase
MEDSSEKAPVDLSTAAGISRKDFDNEKERASSNFNVSRGLLRNEERDAEGYIDRLPTLEGKNVVELIEDEVTKRKLNALRTGEPYKKVRILDVGYGAGYFLLDCAERWGNDVELSGFGLDKYAKAENAEQIEQAGISLIDGNIIDIQETLEENEADVLVCNDVIQWVEYPRWEIIKQLYHTVRPGGIALASGVSPSLRSVSLDKPDLATYLNEQGYQFEIRETEVAFRKTKDRLDLPIHSVGDADSGIVKISS